MCNPIVHIKEYFVNIDGGCLSRAGQGWLARIFNNRSNSEHNNLVIPEMYNTSVCADPATECLFPYHIIHNIHNTQIRFVCRARKR